MKNLGAAKKPLLNSRRYQLFRRSSTSTTFIRSTCKNLCCEHCSPWLTENPLLFTSFHPLQQESTKTLKPQRSVKTYISRTPWSQIPALIRSQILPRLPLLLLLLPRIRNVQRRNPSWVLLSKSWRRHIRVLNPSLKVSAEGVSITNTSVNEASYQIVITGTSIDFRGLCLDWRPENWLRWRAWLRNGNEETGFPEGWEQRTPLHP